MATETNHIDMHIISISPSLGEYNFVAGLDLKTNQQANLVILSSLIDKLSEGKSYRFETNGEYQKHGIQATVPHVTAGPKEIDVVPDAEALQSARREFGDMLAWIREMLDPVGSLVARASPLLRRVNTAPEKRESTGPDPFAGLRRTGLFK